MENISPSASSTIKETKTMSFPEAMKYIIKGKKVTKLEWANPDYYVFCQETLKLHKPHEGFFDWIVSKGDMAGTDWVVLE